MSDFSASDHPRSTDGRFATKTRNAADVNLTSGPDLPDLDPALAPAGTYFVGDPCYTMDSDQWDAMLDQTGLAEQDGAGAAVMPDGTVRRMWIQGTRDGDGTYEDDNGRDYNVDSGSLGLVPIEEIDPALHEGLERNGAILTFPSPVTISNDDDGIIEFGGLRINTGDPDPVECYVCGHDEDLNGYCNWCGDACEHCGERGCDGDCTAAQEAAAEDAD